MPPYHRDVSHGLQFFRALLLGRSWNSQNRFQDQLSPRPYPKANLPIGPANLASSNDYYKRDARRMVQPNLELTKQLSDGKNNAPKGKVPTPGEIYNY